VIGSRIGGDLLAVAGHEAKVLTKSIPFLLLLLSLSRPSTSTQASPHDPENFPFVLLGNKIDQGESKRMVRCFFPLIPSSPQSSPLHFQSLCAYPGLSEASHDLVPIQGKHPLLRDLGEGGHQRRAGFPDDRQERVAAGGRGGAVRRLPRSYTYRRRWRAELRRVCLLGVSFRLVFILTRLVWSLLFAPSFDDFCAFLSLLFDATFSPCSIPFFNTTAFIHRD